MEKIKVETESPKLTTATVSQEVQNTIAKNLKATADAKKKRESQKTAQKKTSKPTFTKKGGNRSKELKAATTSLADVFKALKQN